MKNKPIFLLLNKKSKNNHFVKIWLKESGFSMSEAPDAFWAMEEISDFTDRFCPEVVLIEALSPFKDFCLIQKMMSGEEDGISIFALSEHENIINHKQCFEGNFSEIKAKFSLLYAKSLQAKTA